MKEKESEEQIRLAWNEANELTFAAAQHEVVLPEAAAAWDRVEELLRQHVEKFGSNALGIEEISRD